MKRGSTVSAFSVVLASQASEMLALLAWPVIPLWMCPFAIVYWTYQHTRNSRKRLYRIRFAARAPRKGVFTALSRTCIDSCNHDNCQCARRHGSSQLQCGTHVLSALSRRCPDRASLPCNRIAFSRLCCRASGVDHKSTTGSGCNIGLISP